jgi:hypothetical protein
MRFSVLPLLPALLVLLSPAAWAQTAAGSAQLPVLAWEPRSDWQNVKTTGAAGDGTTDDTAAIQKVLDAAQDGTTVYLPPGTYRITKTLTLLGPRHGFLLIGHGRETTLSWDGADGGKLFMDDGVAYSRFVGIQFEGHGKAAIGFYHYSDRRFETEVRHQHLAFSNFTEAGVLAEPKDKFALSETLFDNCLFENCAVGVSFTQFNDYDFTFDGCEFRTCGTAVDCVHGNFYVRDCRFEESRDVDIRSSPEHGSSVRRCISVGSKQFIRYSHPVSTMTIEGCLVSGWLSPDGAISLSGAPIVLFDCTFTNGPANSAPVKLPGGAQRLLISQNTAPGAPGLFQPGHNGRIYEIPAGQRQGAVLEAGQHFLKSTVAVPQRIFDAKRDFGAKADGTTDDTAAVQQAIDAARAAGQGAIAYLPTGNYVIRETLRLRGGGYTVGGSGWCTRLLWRGAEGGTLILVEAPQNLTLEHLNAGSHDAGAMNNGVDILQTGTTGPSLMTYDGVYTFGMYQKQPFRKGFQFKNLGPQDEVRLPHVQGNLHVTDCAQATILGGCTYEGSVVVDGKDLRRSGLLGFMTRLATVCTHGLYLRDNQSIVMSDFYVEQSDNGFVFEGEPGLPPGRATIQGAKVHFTVGKDEPGKGTAMEIHDYAGQVFFGHSQFYVEPTDVRLRHTGTAPFDLFLLGICFYRTRPAVEVAPSAHVWLLGNDTAGEIPETAPGVRFDAADTLPPERWPEISRALDDLRRLGAADLRLNHGIATGPAPR